MTGYLRDIMTQNPVTVQTTDTVVAAARSMRDGNIGDVVVVERGQIQGILTDRDIVVRADMATEIDAARLLCYRAATMKDAGERVTQASAMAKLYASEVAVRATEKGVQIFGGYGFIKDFPAEKYYRDVKLCTIGEGTSEIQRMVIARNLLADAKTNG